jgi:RNA polymerase sigma-70 factor (ECF subfamily)
METIGKLPVKQRTVFNLYAVEHYPHSKIAETLGISVANSKVLLTRARAELQQRLKVMAMRR